MGTNNLKTGTRWSCGDSHAAYINLPDLSVLCALYGYRLNYSFMAIYPDLNSMGLSLVSLMNEIEKYLESVPICAVSTTELTDIDDDQIGTTVSFDQMCRTKNPPSRNNSNRIQGPCIEPMSGQHIYWMHGEWMFVLPINPKWITTVHAMNTFHSGRHRFAGICTIQSVRTTERLIVAKPVLIVVPVSAVMRLLFPLPTICEHTGKNSR